MNIFYEMASRLGFYKDVKNCLLKGFTPCAVTGVSNIHKAQTAMALSRLSPCLVICDDEASAIRMTGDINEMAGEQLACVFPAKDLNFAYMEGVSREYEHKRLEALSLITQGKCKIIAASMEACLQGTIPQDKLKEFSFEIKTVFCKHIDSPFEETLPAPSEGGQLVRTSARPAGTGRSRCNSVPASGPGPPPP